MDSWVMVSWLVELVEARRSARLPKWDAMKLAEKRCSPMPEEGVIGKSELVDEDEEGRGSSAGDSGGSN
jgi:hypothetical protein